MKKMIYTFPILAGACWGSAGVFVRALQNAGLSNWTIIFGRMVMTVILLGIWMLIRDRSLFRINVRDIPLMAATGMIGYSLMNVFYNYAIEELSLSLTAVLLCTAPVFVLLFGRVVWKEKLTPLKITCLFSVLLGCVLLSGIFDSEAVRWSTFGLALGVCCSLSNAVCTLGSNEETGVRGINPLTAMFYNSLFSIIPVIFFTDFGQLADFFREDPAYALGAFFLNSFMTSLLPNIFFTISFIYMESGIVSILASGAEPTAALIFGILIFDEIPTTMGFIGMVIVIGSILILTGSGKKEPDRSSEDALTDDTGPGEDPANVT